MKLAFAYLLPDRTGAQAELERDKRTPCRGPNIFQSNDHRVNRGHVNSSDACRGFVMRLSRTSRPVPSPLPKSDTSRNDGEVYYRSGRAANASWNARSPGAPFSIARIARLPLLYTIGIPNQGRSLSISRLRCMSTSAAESPMRKNPEVTLAVTAASCAPAVFSAGFIRIAETLEIPPNEKSADRNEISIVWLAGSDSSAFRRSDTVTCMRRSGISSSARIAGSGGFPSGDTISVFQITATEANS